VPSQTPKPKPDPLRSLAGYVGAQKSWGNTVDRSGRTAPARAKFLDRFLEEADGDPVRAEHLKKAYFAGLSLKSAIARKKAPLLRQIVAEGEAAEVELSEVHGDDAA
jgi:hypothetical protein